MKILYFSSVSYGWLKQRPQFVAEKLAQKHQVTYASLTPLGKPLYKAENVTGKLKICDLKVLPFALKSRIVRFLNRLYLNLRLKFKNYDLIVVTHPVQVFYIPEKCKVLYECMDNMEQFYKGKERETVIAAEEILCNKTASQIIVSSFALGNKLGTIAADKEKITVIKNAVDKEWAYSECAPISLKSPNMVYIGTVSEWFDFELIMKYCKNNPDTTVYVIGKNELEEFELKAPGNMIFTGKVDHGMIKSYILSADLLLMPFKVNELIEMVDPVKMYEYLALDKAVLASYWDELKDYITNQNVYFYNDEASFFETAQKVEPKGTGKPAQDFIEENCWDTRIKEYEKVLNKIQLL